MSEHKFKVGDRVRERSSGDVGTVTNVVGKTVYAEWDNQPGYPLWAYASDLSYEPIRKTKSNGSVTQRLRRELDAKSEEVEKLNDQIQRLCKQIDDMVKERCTLVAEIDREMDIKDARLRVLEGQVNAASVLDRNDTERGKSNDTRVLDCIQALMGLRGER